MTFTFNGTILLSTSLSNITQLCSVLINNAI
jgi:hypothetical protein